MRGGRGGARSRGGAAKLGSRLAIKEGSVSGKGDGFRGKNKGAASGKRGGHSRRGGVGKAFGGGGGKVIGGGKTIRGGRLNFSMVKWKDVTPVAGTHMLMDPRNPAAGGFMGLEEIDPAEFEGLVAGGEMEGGGDLAGGAMEGGDSEGGGESGEEAAGVEPGDGDVEADGGESGTGLGDGGGAGEKQEEGKEEGEEEGDAKEREEGVEREDGEDKEEGEEGEEKEGEEGEEDGEESDGEGTGGEAVEEREGEEGEGEEREEDIDMPEWEPLRLHPLILRALSDLGFTSPTAIQRACIPAAASRGRDVVGAAETGSGKTLAFAIPILQRLLDEREKERRLKDGGGTWGEEGEGEGEDAGGEGGGEGGEGAGGDRDGEEQSREGEGGGEGDKEGEGDGVGKKAMGGGVRKRVKGPLRALIITPTRELALQIVSHIKDAARHTGIHVAGIVGGMAEVKQRRVLSLGPQIVVGTPGRLWELMSQGEAHLVQLEYLSFLVLDEADRMADPGRFKELSSILGMLPPTAASLAAAKAKEAALAARDAARAAKKAARAAKIAAERDAARGKKGKGKAGMERAEKEGEGEEEEEKEKLEEEEESKGEKGREEGEEGGEDGEEGEVGEEQEGGEGGGEEAFPLQPTTLAKKKRQVLVFSATLVLPDDTRGQLQGKKRTPGGPGAERRTGRKREREGAQGGEGGEEDEGEKEREKGLERDRVVAALMELTGMRPSPAIVDLTTANVVASGVQEAALECDDSMRDVFLLYLLRMHGTFGRTLVFCSAISSVRRLASLLSLLQVPSFPLHAQQQQRQRLKALDRFKQHPSGVLVATDVAARGLDVPEVRLVVHYQLPHTAEGYVHRCGRTARGAASEGCSVALVTPKDSIKYSSLLRKLNKTGPLPTFPVDHNYLPNLKQCVSLALSVDTLSRKHSKEKAETSWKQRASKAVQVNLEEGGEEEEEEGEGGGEEEREEEDFDDFDEAGGESDDEGERGGRGKRSKKQQQREEEERRSKRRRGGMRGGDEEEEGDVDRGVDVRRLVGRGEKRGWEGPGETGEDGRQQMKQETIELQRMKEALKQAVSQPLRPTNLRSLNSTHSGATPPISRYSPIRASLPCVLPSLIVLHQALKQAVSQPLRPTNLRSLISAVSHSSFPFPPYSISPNLSTLGRNFSPLNNPCTMCTGLPPITNPSSRPLLSAVVLSSLLLSSPLCCCPLLSAVVLSSLLLSSPLCCCPLLSAVVLSSLLLSSPLCCCPLLSAVVLSSLLLSSPLCCCPLLSAVVLSSLLLSSPLCCCPLLSAVVLSSLLLSSPLCCRPLLSAVVLSSLLLSSPLCCCPLLSAVVLSSRPSGFNLLERGSSGVQGGRREAGREVGDEGAGMGEGEGGVVGGEEGEEGGHGSSSREEVGEGGGGVVGAPEGEEAGEGAGMGGEEAGRLAGGVVGEGEGEVGRGGWRECFCLHLIDARAAVLARISTLLNGQIFNGAVPSFESASGEPLCLPRHTYSRHSFSWPTANDARIFRGMFPITVRLANNRSMEVNAFNDANQDFTAARTRGDPHLVLRNVPLGYTAENLRATILAGRTENGLPWLADLRAFHRLTDPYDGSAYAQLRGLPVAADGDPGFERIPAVLWIPDQEEPYYSLACAGFFPFLFGGRVAPPVLSLPIMPVSWPAPLPFSSLDMPDFPLPFLSGRIIGQQAAPAAFKKDPGLLLIGVDLDVEVWTCSLCDFECGLALDSAMYHLNSDSHRNHMQENAHLPAVKDKYGAWKAATLLQHPRIAAFLQ
ncbi:unnamed protein product [Closterium sp. Naga37s-1]|nr:unnamed protein product [Closterium sp. Naga37s-1]